jgi:hypothetical protein
VLAPPAPTAQAPIIPSSIPAAFAARTATTSAAPTRTRPLYTAQSAYSTSVQELAYSLPPRETDIRVGDRITEARVTDPGPQIIAIRGDLVRKVRATINTSRGPRMEGASGVIYQAISRDVPPYARRRHRV